MNIKQIQKHMGQYFLQQEDGSKLSDTFTIESEEELIARLSIYKNNFYFSLIEVLADTFPTVKKILGDEFFKATCQNYLQQTPPTSPIVLESGEQFPAFLKNFKPISHIEYLADVAMFDWYRQCSYHSPFETALNQEDFQKFNPNHLVFSKVTPVDSAFILSSNYAVYSIWELNQAPESQKQQVDSNDKESVLIIQDDGDIQVYLLDENLYEFLNLLTQENTIANALEHVMSSEPEFNASAAIAFIIQSGFAKNLSYEGEEH